MSDRQEWKLSADEAIIYADQLRALAASRERRALLALELEACADVIIRQGSRIDELERKLASRKPEDIGLVSVGSFMGAEWWREADDYPADHFLPLLLGGAGESDE